MRREELARSRRVSAARLALTGLVVPVLACARGVAARAPAAGATQPAITAADLRTRLYVLAADSMMGREAGTAGNVKATSYIAAEFRRLGLVPAGDSGTYFQRLPLARLALDDGSWLAAGGMRLGVGPDFLPLDTDGPRRLSAQAVYGGLASEPAQWITANQAAGRLVVLAVPAGQIAYVPTSALAARPQFAKAAAFAVAEMHLTPPQLVAAQRTLHTALRAAGSAEPLRMLLSSRAAERLFGAPFDSLRPGTLGQAVQMQVSVTETPIPHPVRNVVAILRGSDPALRGEYVALGAHNDHIGLSTPPLDHDSVRIFNRLLRPRGAETPPRLPTAGELARLRAALDSLRHVRPARPDSVNNGADDDGSGTAALLEIAEALARSAERPRRSVLFVSHTAEELGLYGSQWFTDHPTVPRDSIGAQLNLDMIGRGDAADIEGGGPTYLEVIGSRRLSTELGDLLEAANRARPQPFAFDYSYDAPGHPEQFYCRSDHYMYARYGIPIAFLTGGVHPDYHQVTDEPQYVDYPKMARVAELVHAVALRVADLDHRVVVDKPKPDPKAPCRQ